MKQAILITAYKDFNQLKRLILEFDHRFNIYIHIDKKSPLQKDLIKELLKISTVQYVAQDFKVNWGGLNHLKAYLKLCKIALQNKENAVFHLITGQDFPIKSNKEFDKYLQSDINHLSAFTMPNAGWKNGGMDRIELYNFYDVFDAKKSSKWLYIIKRLQLRLKFKRSTPNSLGQLYGGNTYWSLRREAVQYVVTYSFHNPKILKRFKYTLCAEEIFFQTILMNSKFKEAIVHDDLRFMDWASGRGGYPAILDESDFEKITQSGKLFARKLDQNKNDLFSMLSNNRTKKISD